MSHQPIDPKVVRGAKALITSLLVHNPKQRLTARQVVERAWVAEAHARECDSSGSGMAGADERFSV